MESLSIVQIHQLLGELVYANRQIALVNQVLAKQLAEQQAKEESNKVSMPESVDPNPIL